jgi:hypothetical protein
LLARTISRSRPSALCPKLSSVISADAASRRSSQARVSAYRGVVTKPARSAGVIQGSSWAAISRSLAPDHGRAGGSAAAGMSGSAGDDCAAAGAAASSRAAMPSGEG